MNLASFCSLIGEFIINNNLLINKKIIVFLQKTIIHHSSFLNRSMGLNEKTGIKVFWVNINTHAHTHITI